jgi:peptide/nickel transport system substrate-binding protein
MKHKIFRIALAAAISVIAIAASAAEPKTGGKLSLIVQPEPTSLMLGMVQNGATQLVAGEIYESLLRYDENLNPMPSLAKEWSVSADGLVYTFNLQDGVKWHDGKDFSAEDVVFSYDVFLRKTHPRFRAILEHVAKIEATDKKTVVFTLKSPFGPFLRSFESSTAPVVPKHIYDGTDYSQNPANATPIGTGSFKLDKWEKGSFIHLVRNPDYYLKNAPKLDEIYYRIIPDAASRAIAYETGEVDVLPSGTVELFDLPRLQALENTCVTEKGWEFFGPLSFIWMNNRSGVLANPMVRKAVNLAIDRTFAVDAIWAGFGKPATGPVNSSTRFYSDKTSSIQFDPEAAKALLKDAGYKGETLRLLPLPYGEVWQRWAEAVKQNLSDVGVNVELVATDVAGWNQRLGDWDFDMAFTYLYQYGDPALGVSRSYVSTNIAKGSPWNNVAGYANPEVDKLLTDASSATSDESRAALYEQAQKMIVADAPVAWLTEMQSPTLYRCDVKDLVTSSIGLNDSLRDTWLDR